ncbi:MAG: ABC transporter ATP-binding protein [Candidatus Magnetoovum sp. WYHC-5]|nr:ABC transporter ATP-binding protein [Candidatus Magnetoovum sp. WYHC-5]
MEDIIKTEDVVCIFNRGLPDEMVALRGVSVEIKRGEICVLRGASGCGKTTLLSLIGCMARPTSGKIMVRGRDVAKLTERFLTEIRRSTFGFIFQQFNLIRELTVFENVALPLYPLDSTFLQIKHMAEEVLGKLHIIHKKNAPIRQLSGGEQQRVAIARALINNPEIILADEPTAHLDSKLSNDLIDIMVNLNKEGKTIIIATHDPEVFEHAFINRTIFMKDGLVREVRTQ